MKASIMPVKKGSLAGTPGWGEVAEEKRTPQDYVLSVSHNQPSPARMLTSFFPRASMTSTLRPSVI